MTACRGRHITSASSWCPASAEHREPIVPRAVRRNASRSPRVRRGACQAHRRNRLLHAYCNRIQMFGCSSEAWKAEVTKGLVRPPRCRACWRQMVATLWGGECCSLGFSLSRHRPGKGGTPIEPATLASVVATLFSRKRLKKREKADKSASDFTANLAHVDRKRKQMSSRLWAYLIPVFRMLVLSP